MKENKLIFIGFIILAASFYFITPLQHYAGLIALILGILLSSSDKFYQPPKLNKYRKLILNTSVIFFGFSLNIHDVITIGLQGIIFSFISLSVILSCGFILIKLYQTDKITSALTTYGTGICGGSAISAVSTILNPTNKQLALATGIVFSLNGLALVIFPPLGHLLHMNQEQFGVFCALSIHDVSSVVGAASIYGDTSLKLATVLKLTRTLWIIPITIILARFNQQKNSKLPIPFFILGFILASIITSILNNPLIISLNIIGKFLLPIALFMVGYAIKLNDIKALGAKELKFGLSLWLISIISGITLAFLW
ncbi:MAG: YeiH family protein [Mycoplasmatales bacterium]